MRALPRPSPPAEDEAAPRGWATLSGEVAVAHSRETAAAHLVDAFVGGALALGLRIARRDAAGLTFRAATAGAFVTGPASGTLTVSTRKARTIVSYRLSLGSAYAFAAVLAIGLGVASAGLVPSRMGLGTLGAAGAGIVVGIVAGGAYAAWVAHRTRVRFETLLHNLRYVS